MQRECSRLTRRRLLQSGVALCAGAAIPPRLHALGLAEGASRLRLHPGRPLASVPKNFLGLGFEMSSAARPGLLSADNAAYVQLVRNLGPSGVLRLGGIVADFTRYAATEAARTEPKDTIINRASLRQLRGFLDRTGWTAIWSLNFGRGTLDEALAEATDVAEVLGPRLLAVELGNEVENYGRGDRPLRPPPYPYEAFRAEYMRWYQALVAAVPGLRFAAPDTAASVEWVERMAADARGDVQLLTTHYYRGSQQQGTFDQLMRPDPALQSALDRLRRASGGSGLPWRMCETNSFFGGGRPGVSDTLAGALWTLNYLLLLAQAGCAGVNLETGVNQLGFVSSYSPIQDDGAGHNSAGAPYYGMLAFAAAVREAPSVLPLTCEGNEALTAYALGAGTALRSVVVIHQGTDRSVRVSLPQSPLRGASVLRLTGPSLESKTGITFAGAAVDRAGRWAPAPAEPLRGAEVILPPASAVVIRAMTE